MTTTCRRRRRDGAPPRRVPFVGDPLGHGHPWRRSFTRSRRSRPGRPRDSPDSPGGRRRSSGAAPRRPGRRGAVRRGDGRRSSPGPPRRSGPRPRPPSGRRCRRVWPRRTAFRPIAVSSGGAAGGAVGCSRRPIAPAGPKARRLPRRSHRPSPGAALDEPSSRAMQDGPSPGAMQDGPAPGAGLTGPSPAAAWTSRLPRPPGRAGSRGRYHGPSPKAARTRRLIVPARQELGHHAAAFYFHRATDDFYTIGQQPPYVSHRNHAETAQP